MNFANRTIWTADNIEILPGIDSECVDLVYLDPPFNSNKDYAAPIGSKAAGAAFKDTWTLSDLDVAAMGRLADAPSACIRRHRDFRTCARQGHDELSRDDGR